MTADQPGDGRNVDVPGESPYAEADASTGDGEVGEDAFVEMEVGDLDGVDPPYDDIDADRASAVVPKRSYCERCVHFSAPPDMACTNEGTEIVELVDTDHVHVVDCPVVERRREIGEAAPIHSDESE